MTAVLGTLRREVRAFLDEERSRGSFTDGPGLWLRFDSEFSAKLGDRGWIGMTVPVEYGGHGRSALERYVVTEELLASGAPLRAHWVSDRQIAPNLLKFGTEFQKKELLPKIASGRCFFCIGMSEPNSGSDVASISTKAVRADKGWIINGRKIWTSNAHRAHYTNLIARTSTDPANRRNGLSQFIVDMKSPGVKIRPIINMPGEHDFNEVELNDVFVPDEWVVGEVENAWRQLSTDLAYERSGPERWLGSHALLSRAIDYVARNPSQSAKRLIGTTIAELFTLHRMSFGIAIVLQRGEAPVVQASITKDLGTHFEKSLPDVVASILGEVNPEDISEEYSAMLRYAFRNAPTLTVKGGTAEILRGIIAKDLGLR